MKQSYTRIILIIAALTFYAGAVMAQSTIPGSRLIAQSHYMNTGGSLVAYDSQSYVYPNAVMAQYTQKLSYLYNAAWIHTRKADYTYNSAGNLISMEFQNWSTATNAYVNGGMTFYTLNGAGYCIKDSNLLWIPANNAYRDNVRNTYVVNAAGQITDHVYENWDAGANHLLPYYHHANTYNAQGNPLVLLTQDWDASIHWMDYLRTTYAYDASGTKLETLTGEQAVNTPGVLQTTYQDVYTLNADGTIASYLSNIWNSSSASYKPSMSIVMTYDAAGDNTLQTQEDWDVVTNAYKPYQQFVSTYNAHHQLTSQTRMMWDGSAYAIPSSRDNYYYEDFGTPSGIANTAPEEARLSVAPIPTAGELRIVLSWQKPQAFTATVTDMNGRLCSTFSGPENKEYSGNLNLSSLPAGNYVLLIRGALGGSISRMIVLRR